MKTALETVLGDEPAREAERRARIRAVLGDDFTTLHDIVLAMFPEPEPHPLDDPKRWLVPARIYHPGDRHARLL